MMHKGQDPISPAFIPRPTNAFNEQEVQEKYQKYQDSLYVKQVLDFQVELKKQQLEAQKQKEINDEIREEQKIIRERLELAQKTGTLPREDQLHNGLKYLSPN